MAPPFRIGVMQLTMEPLEEMLASARVMDEAGIDTIWLAEAYPWWRKHGMEARSSTVVSALIAHETEQLTVGWGIISPFTRHPVQVAMDARVVQEAAGPVPARFRDVEDLPQQRPDRHQENAWSDAGGGRDRSRRARRRGLRVRGRDVLGLGAGARSRGRRPARRAVPLRRRNCAEDADAGGRDRGRPADAFDHDAGLRALLESAEIEMDELAPVAEAMEHGGRLAAKGQVSDTLLDRCRPIAGTPEDCIAAIEEYREAGCTHVMLELWGADRHEQIRLFGEKVLPAFR